ncbi:DUF1317 family protein [Salmonella enterica]|nr:DUF1317 family protein [Salmonella enterica]EKR1796343.1 DUF1317 family protein [Salmonella enterica subsp. diarizonae serovar 65:z10:e,n,x,z15]EHM1399632.1 DUF1317 family protein [Salmonella enterica]EHS6388141.1 DUF1317 family protein [Salmonella enterica]EIA3224117.1 DUF1317 family protein [Salmonella enterica]
MDAAVGEVERARIAIRRDQCISKGNGLRRGLLVPGGNVIQNPFKDQRIAELMNSKKVAA